MLMGEVDIFDSHNCGSGASAPSNNLGIQLGFCSYLPLNANQNVTATVITS